MDSVDSAVCNAIQPNPDVSGTGIRASIYALCLGGRLLSLFTRVFSTKEMSDEFTRSYKNSLSIQGMALLCTAWYETAHAQLTLFHAIVVLHLLALLGINLASRISPKDNNLWVRLWMNTFLIIFAIFGFIAFNVYVWIKAPTFGSQPECNSSTVYVMFGVSITATNPVFRYIILATLAIIPALFVIVLIIGLPCWAMARCCIGGVESDDVGCKPYCTFTRSRPSSSDSDGQNHDNILNEGLQTVAYMAFSIYAVVSLEQMINRNKVSYDESQWTFGQIVALFLLLGPALDFLNAVVAGFNKGAMNVRS